MAARNVLDFDGSGDYVSMPANAAYTGSDSLNVGVWIYVTAADIAGGFLVAGVYDTAGNNRSWSLRWWDSGTGPGGGDYFSLTVSNNGIGIAGATFWSFTPVADTWYYIECRWVADTRGELWVGTEGASPAIVAETGTSGGTVSALNDAAVPLRFGSLPYTADADISGYLIEGRLWRNTSRSLSDAQSDYKDVLTGSETGLAGYWRMNEGSGSIVADLSTTDNDGSITGATWASVEDPLQSSAAAVPQGTVTIGSITPGVTTAEIPYSYDDTDETGYEYRLDGGTAASLGASPATITGLTASTTYGIEVRAVNATGAGAWSSVSSFTTDAAAAVVEGVTITLYNGETAQVSITDIHYLVTSGEGPESTELDSGIGEATDGSGVIVIDLSSTAAAVDDVVYVCAFKRDASVDTDSLGWQGMVTVTDIS